ncbi:MAG: SIS domain-containing protein [bacterium]|nr:SIS domain-containing protein [bacterium]
MPKLFGTSGIRGPAETLFTKEFCTKLGVVFGTWLKDKGKSGYVAIAMDPRDSSPRIKEQIVMGLAALGWEILDEGVIPTPALTYFVKQSPHVGGGVMITGSHITADLNGVKLFVDGEEVTKIHEAEIEKLFAQVDYKTLTSSPIVKHEDAARDLYVNMLTDLADMPYPQWKIVLDTANGAQSEIMRELLDKIGVEFSCSDYCDIQSPHFVPRDTESQNSAGDLTREVLTTKADLGVAFDVDGDRVVFVDDTGRFVPGDYSCTLIAQDSSSPAIVTPINTSSVIDHIDKKIFRTPVGSTNVAAKMKEVGATFGFEANGGAISSEIFYGRDGAATVVKLFNLLKKHKQSLSEAVDSLPQFHLFRDKLDCPPGKFAAIYAAAKEKYSGKPIDETDGVKIDLGDEEWILFRASGNAPEFRVFVQSKDKSRAQRLGQDGLAWVRGQIGTGDHQVQAPVFTDSLGIKKSLQMFPQQFAQVISDISLQHVPHDCMLVNNIVLAGMGGSALAGRIVASLEQEMLRIPFSVCTGFKLPNFVNNKSLVIISSYSGNTAETLSALADAQARQAQIYILSSGGQLAGMATENDIPAYIYETAHNPCGQPRMGLGYSLASVLFLLTRCQLISVPATLNNLPQFLEAQMTASQTAGQQMAEQLAGRAILLMASNHLLGSAHAVKNMLNENSKTLSALFDLPEANHHLMEGLAFPKSNSQHLAVLLFESSQYQTEIQARYPLTEEIISKQHIPVVKFPQAGTDTLEEAVSTLQTGAWLSFYLAGQNRVDPGPIPWVDYLKEKLS